MTSSSVARKFLRWSVVCLTVAAAVSVFVAMLSLEYNIHSERDWCTFPKFTRKPETAHIDCGRLILDGKLYTKDLALKRPRLVPRKLKMDCNSIHQRVLFSAARNRIAFGIAYARIVYEAYEFLEDELMSSYHPQNYFCFSVDLKAEQQFFDDISTLAGCLPNVMVAKYRHNITSSGRNMNRAHQDCLKLLIGKEGWGYVILMQNYDVMIKSVYEVVYILHSLGGVNDIYVRPCEKDRWNQSAKWDAQSLGLFPNGPPSLQNTSITIARGAVQASLSRDAVQWMMTVANLTALIDQLDSDVIGADEVLLASLHVSDTLEMPGRFTGECVNKGYRTDYITR
ncbi:hypothetical protein Q1695_006622 [Nippostrongylus brasiliensis]|nr:hypothetical protein Q1695_006622 [Nippostrongylus brasiliensis]